VNVLASDVVAAAADTSVHLSGGETVAFWVLGPVALAGALGMVFSRNAVHSALWLVCTMLSLGVFYVIEQAPFLGAVQIIVYTGAIMILFLFVLMLVGRDSSDSVVETLRGQRVAATVLGIGFAGLVGAGIARATEHLAVTGLDADALGADGNVGGIARLLFTRYLLAFEITSALLITAAVGAMVLAHRERLEPKPTQASLAAQRLQDYALTGKHPGPLPTPGVFARHNAVDTPALLPDGTASEASVSRVLAARGTVRSAPAMADQIEGVRRQLGVDPTAMPETSGTAAGAPAHTEEDVDASPSRSARRSASKEDAE
jgi:NADH-quinone oxidoreductase subunit J